MPDSRDTMDREIRRQVEIAVGQADVVLLLVDGREGVHPGDRDIADRLRKSGRPVVLAVNKLDDLPVSQAHHQFWELGLGEPLAVSAAVGKSSGDLLDVVVERFPPRTEAEDEEAVAVAVVGRPNVGKSSLVNRLLGEDRHVVSESAGTTRDAIDSPMRYHGRALTFIDTAGLRKRAKVDDQVEFYSTLRTQRAIDRADVCVLVVDAALGVHVQDIRIANEAWERGAALIVAVNKWDLIPEKDTGTAKRGQDAVVERAPFLKEVPFLYLSAVSGQRVRQLLDLILEVADARQHRVATAEVNRVLEELVDRNMPPQSPGDEVKLLYATQVATAPPAFAVFCNRPESVPESYQRYLVHGFRQAWGFKGSPIRLKLRRRSGRSARS